MKRKRKGEEEALSLPLSVSPALAIVSPGVNVLSDS
jgi:hypothetical protein